MAGFHSTDPARMLVIGLVTVAVISGGAATIAESVVLQDSIVGSDSFPGGSPTASDNTTVPGGVGGEPSGSTLDLDISRCVEPLNALHGTLAYFGAFGLLFWGIHRRYGGGAAMMAAMGGSPFVLTTYYLTTDCTAIDGPRPGGDPWYSWIVESSLPVVEVSPIVLVGVLGAVVVAAAAVAVRATGDQIDEVDVESEASDPPDVTDLAAAAGATADRLEIHNADVDNAVYRAWWEMTELLDVPNPDSATPGEFADEAVDVGLGSEHVDRLTTLFEEVRYGRRDAASREERAASVFRTIEEEYGASSSAEFDTGGDEAGSGPRDD